MLCKVIIIQMDNEKIDDIVNEMGERCYAVEEELKIVRKKMDDIMDSILFLELNNKSINNKTFKLLELLGWKPEHERI